MIFLSLKAPDAAVPRCTTAATNNKESNNVDVCSYEFVRRLATGLFQTPSDVELLEGVETGENTGAGDAAKNVGAGALHHRHETFVLHDLNGAVDGALVLDGGARGHHHTTTNGVDGVGHQTGGDGDAVTQAEGQEQTGVGT